jgi:hypothetical protein
MTEQMKPNWAYKHIHKGLLPDSKDPAVQRVNGYRRSTNVTGFREGIMQEALEHQKGAVVGRDALRAEYAKYGVTEDLDIIELEARRRLFPSEEYMMPRYQGDRGLRRIIPGDDNLALRNIDQAALAERQIRNDNLSEIAQSRWSPGATQETIDTLDILFAAQEIADEEFINPRIPHVAEGYFFNEQGQMTAEPIWGQPLDPHTQRMQAEAQKFAPKHEETK